MEINPTPARRTSKNRYTTMSGQGQATACSWPLVAAAPPTLNAAAEGDPLRHARFRCASPPEYSGDDRTKTITGGPPADEVAEGMPKGCATRPYAAGAYTAAPVPPLATKSLDT